MRAWGCKPTWILGGGSPTPLDLGRRAADPPGLWAAGCIATWIVAAGWLLYLYLGRITQKYKDSG